MIAEPWPTHVGLEVFDELDSTQTEARRRAVAGEAGPTWIVARRQTAGYGRRGRSWTAPEGNLSTTVLLRPPVAISGAPQISFVAALAVADLIDRYAPGRCTLKWPNDPLLDGRKVAGILPDSAGRADGKLDWLIVGFGVNLADSPSDTPYPTASLFQATGQRPDPDVALAVLANAWEHRLGQWMEEGFTATRDAWLARAHGLGGPISVRLPNGTFDAVFEGLDLDGALMARLPSGEMRRVAAGDVFPVSR